MVVSKERNAGHKKEERDSNRTDDIGKESMKATSGLCKEVWCEAILVGG